MAKKKKEVIEKEASKEEGKEQKKAEPKKEPMSEEIKKLIKLTKAKYFKDETQDEFREIYEEEFNKIKKKHPKIKDIFAHKRAISTLKNNKTREKIGGAVESVIGVIIGSSKVKDTADTRRGEAIRMFEEDPARAVNENYIMTTKEMNPETGEENKVPVLDDSGNVIPIDSREFFDREVKGEKKKVKNRQFGEAIGHQYRRNLVGVGKIGEEKGIFFMQLSGVATELEVPANKPTKFNAKLRSKSIFEYNPAEFLTKEAIQEAIDALDFDLEDGLIDVAYKERKQKILNELLENENHQITIFNLSNSKGTKFLSSEEDIDELMLEGSFDLEFMIRQFFGGHSADCAHILEYHEKYRYLDEDKKKINWNEVIILNDVNALQINAEESMSGNITMYVTDDSLMYNDVSVNDEQIDSIKVIVPSSILIDFSQDSKITVIGSVFQPPAQDENRETITETVKNEKGEDVEIDVLAYPMILATGIVAPPQYKIEAELEEPTEEEETFTVDEVFKAPPAKKEDKTKSTPSKKEPAKKPETKAIEKKEKDKKGEKDTKKESEEEGEDLDLEEEYSEEDLKEMNEAIDEVNKTKEKEKSKEETEEVESEDESVEESEEEVEEEKTKEKGKGQEIEEDDIW